MNDAELQRRVEERISELHELLERKLRERAACEGVLDVMFLTRSNASIFSSSACWEEWIVRIAVARGPPLGEQLRSTMQNILSILDQNKSHLPPIETADVLPYALKIVAKVTTADAGIKDMLLGILRSPLGN